MVELNYKDYVKFMTRIENAFECGRCPENHSNDDCPCRDFNGNYPCGQQNCWVEVHCSE